MPVFSVIILVTILIAGSAIKSVSARAAASDMANVQLSNVTKKDIEDAKKKRDETKKKAKSAAQKIYELKTKKKQVNYDLMALNDANDEQRQQYEEITAQLQAALDARVKALDDYINAEENLEKRTKEFQNRVSVMFQFQNKSMFEVLLESDSLAGFFTNMEIMTLIADADAQAVDSMKIAVDDAKLQKELALKVGCTEAAISHYIKGDRIPRSSVMTKIAIALDTTSDYLMEGIPTDVTGELDYAKKLIARNVTQMSNSEKREIINILMGDDDE
jgi:transcriptional regulator with XRE-family HTH domain